MNQIIDIESLHFIIGIVSSAVCTLLGIILLAVRFCRHIDMKSVVRPNRYIAARKALGWAYIIIGILSLVQLFTVDVTNQNESDSFPLVGLVISISQIILFTAAVLALYNSKWLNSRVVGFNLLPLAILLLLYVAFMGQEMVQFTIRLTLFIYYLLQLIVYLVAFFMARRTYLDQIEDYFDHGELYEKYSFKGITVLYLLSIGIGIWAMASYFFTTLLQETVFITAYTVFYVILAVYYIQYSKHSQRIQDVTTPENWEDTEAYSNTLWKDEKEHLVK